MENYDHLYYGLSYLPELGELNGEDIIVEWVQKEGYHVLDEFSGLDSGVIIEYLKKLGKECKAILEIGINKYPGRSFTSRTILDNKPNECYYLGVDKEPVRCIGLADEKNKIYTICCDSGEYDKIVGYMKEIGIEKLDFIFIDGDHSLNQVLLDWRFSKLLSENGYVVFHDTNIHPGPRELLKALDSCKWKVEWFFQDRKDDWGIAVANHI